MKLLFNNRAFNIIELMITVAIIGILATVAIPNYTDSLRRANIKMTVNQLIAIRNMMIGLREIDDGTLMDLTGSSCARCPFAGVGSFSGDWTPDSTAEARYSRAGLSGLQKDPWGSIFLLDENEGEFADCRQDAVTSVGENHIFDGSESGPTAGDDIRLWVPRHFQRDGCVEAGIELGPDVLAL